jgi:S-formylglutathione hydrolase FrmB
MAFIQCDFFSDVLGLSCSMNVILPQSTTRQIGMEGRASEAKPPTLFLLHGLSDDHTAWMRRTSIERYVADRGIAVVMPAVNRSFYANQVHGLRYFDFVAEELPAVAGGFFHLSDRPEDTYVAGLSMGGYGAFKIALTFPERFCAAASLSGALDLAARDGRSTADTAWRSELNASFGDIGKIADTENDLFHLARQRKSEGRLPRLYACCGTGDFIYEDSAKFRDFAAAEGIGLTYKEGPGEHTWGYWDTMIQDVLDWLGAPDASPE